MCANMNQNNLSAVRPTSCHNGSVCQYDLNLTEHRAYPRVTWAGQSQAPTGPW